MTPAALFLALMPVAAWAPVPPVEATTLAAADFTDDELGAGAVKELVRRASGGTDPRPGIVVAVATAGDLLQWHPHLHLIATDGSRGPDGSWLPVPEWDSVQLMRLFRERLSIARR